VRILGHTGRIPGSYLHDIFQSWHSGFVTMTQLENYISQPCLTVGIYNIVEFLKISLPMGVNDLYFVDKEVKKNCRLNVVDFTLLYFPLK
jgi:hypothetical protein